MMRILICGYPEKTKNYCFLLQMLGFTFQTYMKYDKTQSANNFDALLLPGGGDIAPSLFGAQNLGSENLDLALDQVQLSYLDDFCKAQKPVLGICKGIQLINVYFGGSLLQDLPLHQKAIHATDNTGADRLHLVYALSSNKCPKPSFLSTVQLQNNTNTPSWLVNSAHHQAIDVLGKGLQPTHLSADGVVEGICHTTLPIIGLQWHPERLLFTDT